MRLAELQEGGGGCAASEPIVLPLEGALERKSSAGRNLSCCYFTPRSRRELHSTSNAAIASPNAHRITDVGSSNLAAPAPAVWGPRRSISVASGATSVGGASTACRPVYATPATSRASQVRCSASAASPPAMRQRHEAAYPVATTRPG